MIETMIFAERDLEHRCPTCGIATYLVWFGREWTYGNEHIVEVTKRTEIRRCCLCGTTWSSPEVLLAEAKDGMRAERYERDCGSEDTR